MKRGFHEASPAERAGAAALAAAAALWPVGTAWAALPLGLFLVWTLTAPFRPESRFFLAVISRGGRETRRVALTFDDGPDPATTPALLTLLGQRGLPATFFVTGERAEAHPELIGEILRRGHTLGNHSHRHDLWLMFRPPEGLAEEVARTQRVLERFGIRPRAFRPPVGVTGPRLGAVLAALDMDCVTFSCRGGDFGNRRLRGLARRILRRLSPGAIVLLHDVRPPGGDVTPWLAEVASLCEGLAEGGYQVVPLAELIGRPVMETPCAANEGRKA